MRPPIPRAQTPSARYRCRIGIARAELRHSTKTVAARLRDPVSDHCPEGYETGLIGNHQRRQQAVVHEAESQPAIGVRPAQRATQAPTRPSGVAGSAAAVTWVKLLWGSTTQRCAWG